MTECMCVCVCVKVCDCVYVYLCAGLLRGFGADGEEGGQVQPVHR